jgi:predicted kinase
MLQPDIQNVLDEIKGPYVVLLIGLPLSGKDTFLKQLKMTNPLIVSRDAIILNQADNLSYNEAYRKIPSKLVDKIFYKQLRLAAENKQSVFINITHLTIKKRARSIQYFKNTHTIIGIQFPLISEQEFQIRNNKRVSEESKFISEKVFHELVSLYEPPTIIEGYDYLLEL